MCIPGGIKVISQKNFAWVLLYLKSKINVVFCVINTTILNTLLERFHYIKIARFTRLARITTTVLICILPRVAALVLVAMSGAIFTILPTANYIIMLPAVRYYNRKVEDGFIAAIARNTMTREENCQGHVYYFCCSCHLCDSKNFGCFLFSVVWKPLPQFFPMVHNFIAAEFEYYSQARSCVPPKMSLMNSLLESCIRLQLQISDFKSLHSCMCNGREFTCDSVTKFLPAQFPWIWCKCLLRILIHSKIFNLTKYREVVVKYSLLITHAGMAIWIWHQLIYGTD